MSAGEDHVVIVTGAAGGLGRVMSLGLLAAGRRVAALEVEGARGALDALAAAAREAGAEGRLFPVVANVRSAPECERAVAQTVERFGAVHALINNAGLGMEGIDPRAMIDGVNFYDVPVEKWQAVIDTNVNGPFLMARAIAPRLVERGWGRIVNVVTGYPTMLKAGFSPYGPAKAALEAATVVWSKDLARSGVSVNALLPGGAADTAMVPVESVSDRATLVRPSVMVAPAVWLTSRASDGVTGRRFIGRDWDADASLEDNVRKAGAPAGWQG